MSLRFFGVLIRQSGAFTASPVRMLSTTNATCAKILRESPNAQLNKSLLDRYTKLKYDNKYVQATYVWIDGTGENLRCKDRVLQKQIKYAEEVPNWQYDGSSTYQALGGNSDTALIPRTLYKDPFKAGANDVIVLCDTYKPDGSPSDSNHRAKFMENYETQVVKDQNPWFGIEQEYTFLDVEGRPLGWPAAGFPAPQGPYYCGVGADKVLARDIVEAHALACLYAGVEFAGTNAEVMPAQWEFQVGPSVGMKCADDIWMARYILWRIAEEYGVVVTFDPKPMEGNWNGAGGHCNFSTDKMREEGGIKEIERAIEKLSKRHDKHIKAYDPRGGADNARRLVGRLETSSIHEFSWGVADRGTSVRIPRGVADAGKGYLEDRRPSSNMDPYSVCNAIIETCLLDK